MGVEARLEGVGEKPLDEGVITLKSLVVTVPFCMYLINEFSIRLRGHSVEVELNIQLHLIIYLWLLGR